MTEHRQDLGLRDIDAIGYDETIAREQIFVSARAAGCEIVPCQPNEIQIDLDKPWPFGADRNFVDNLPQVFSLISNIWTVCAFVKVERAVAWVSRHGNTHIVLTLADSETFSDTERVLLAACLGSDSVREALNLKRIREGSVYPVALFRPLTTKVVPGT